MPPAPAADHVADRHWTREVIRRLEADICRSAKTHLIGLDLPRTVLAGGIATVAVAILCDSGLRYSDIYSSDDRRGAATRYGAFLGEAA